MASKRKSYSGTPEQHRKRAGANLKSARRALSQARRALGAGNCSTARVALRNGDYAAGFYDANTTDLPARYTADSDMGEGPLPRGTALSRALSAAWRKYAQKCER